MRTDFVTTAIVVALDIATHSSATRAVATQELCDRHGWTRRSPEIILQELSRANIVEGNRGPAGGYRIAPHAWRKTLGDVGRAAIRTSRATEKREKTKDAAVALGFVAEAEAHYWNRLDQTTIEQAIGREIREGLAMVTPGPWEWDNGEGYGRDSIWAPTGLIAQGVGDSAEAEETVQHLARCSPDRLDILTRAFEARGKEIAALREALTPSGETKADYIGEFKFAAYDGDEPVYVPWPVIKEIMKKILGRAERDALRAKLEGMDNG